MFTAITLILNASTVMFNESSSPIVDLRVEKEPSSPQIETEVIIPVQVLIQNGTVGMNIYIQKYKSKLQYKCIIIQEDIYTCSEHLKTYNLVYCNTCRVSDQPSDRSIFEQL